MKTSDWGVVSFSGLSSSVKENQINATDSSLTERCVTHESLMSEGRQSQVVLLDERRLDILIKPKLYAGELLDMVASHFSLKEKEYFGLAYLDDT
ncbi:FERM domain-containing protein 4A [Trichonephila clavipes]|nr:FERM domain-containing protein 4A [Trichonephila clavipes]